jgi:hypothetical protein
MLLLFAFGHWLVWPAMSRAVYAAERYNFLKERRWFGTLGGILLADAVTGTAWLAEIAKSLN